MIESHKLPTPLVWVEHYPPESTQGKAETFALVIFSSYEVREARAPYMGDRAVRLGEPTWKHLDRRSVEVLVGEKL